jgi:hypothetical protein
MFAPTTDFLASGTIVRYNLDMSTHPHFAPLGFHSPTSTAKPIQPPTSENDINDIPDIGHQIAAIAARSPNHP